ncbi:MAG: hypothetical protein QG608_497 [Actinomycetota bacterium]|nr:hypothetical protein [Actinomycetota bacterium]
MSQERCNWPNGVKSQDFVDGCVSGHRAQVLLPLWHGVRKDDVMGQSPSLACKVALRTSDYTIDEIVAEIAEVIRSS